MFSQKQVKFFFSIYTFFRIFKTYNRFVISALIYKFCLEANSVLNEPNCDLFSDSIISLLRAVYDFYVSCH